MFFVFKKKKTFVFFIEIPISSNVTHSSNLSSETVTMAPPQSVVSNTTFHPLNMPGAENFTGINGSTTKDNESTTPENILYVAVTTKARPAENITCESLKKGLDPLIWPLK